MQSLFNSKDWCQSNWEQVKSRFLQEVVFRLVYILFIRFWLIYCLFIYNYFTAFTFYISPDNWKKTASAVINIALIYPDIFLTRMYIVRKFSVYLWNFYKHPSSSDHAPFYLFIFLLTLVLMNLHKHCLCKQCRSRSVGFWRSQLIWICTVCYSVREFVSTSWIK